MGSSQGVSCSGNKEQVALQQVLVLSSVERWDESVENKTTRHGGRATALGKTRRRRSASATLIRLTQWHFRPARRSGGGR